MAGRYVILEFDDKDAAQAFIDDPDLQQDLKFVTRASYLRPRKFCNCSDKVKHTANNWRKHPKYGLYICSRCRLPSVHHERGIIDRLQYVFGFNLINRKD